MHDDLRAWKQAPTRKPMLLDGARQTGKTHLVQHLFGPREFRKVHALDFRLAPEAARLFAGDLTPSTIVNNIELHFDTDVDLSRDLIFLDEVGECQAALDSLKYFAERAPEAFVCASGSNIGLLTSFPVGKVRQLELFPLCFEEFLMASGQSRLLDAFRSRSDSNTAHERLWSLFLDYCFVGGMPEAVAAWFSDDESLQPAPERLAAEAEGTTSQPTGGLQPLHQSTRERATRVDAIHADLVAGFERDFGKYAGPQQAAHIETLFHNIPRQLQTTQGGSVKRFRFKGVVERKRAYLDLQGPIDWLVKARLAWKCHPINCRPTLPLPHLAKESQFRLFLFDVGILRHMLRLPYAVQRDPKYAYKGFMAENFVQTELRARVAYPTYGWAEARAEVEFLHQTRDGDIIPVEVKSGGRSRARSLSSYIQRYAPGRAITLTASPRAVGSGIVHNWPLYEAQFLREL